MVEFCYNIKPFLQPKPNKNLDGDCFACALTAALQHLFSENPPSFDTVWNYFLIKYKDSDKEGLSHSWPGIKNAIYKARNDYEIDVEYDFVQPDYENEKWSYAFYRRRPSDSQYTRRLEGWLRSGWVAITEIDMHGNGSVVNGKLNDIDHTVILDGIREVWEPFDDGTGRSLNHYIHVVCSVKGAYWIKTQDLLVKYGAAAWWLCRRRENET